MPLDAVGGGALLPEEPSDPERTEKAMGPYRSASLPPFLLSPLPADCQAPDWETCCWAVSPDSEPDPRRARVWRAKLQAQG